MNAVFYMLRKNVKNAIIDTLKSPLKLIVYLFIGASIVFAVIRGFMTERAVEDMLDDRILYGAYLAILYFISIPIMLKGLSTGSNFFKMSDVNNIFVAPISEKKILTYGIGRQLATSLFLVVCFSAYGSMAVKMFEITVGQALMLVGGIAIMLFIVQMTTLLIFCLCSAKPRLTTPLKYFIYSLPIYALGTTAVYMFSNGMTLENLYSAISKPYLEYVPFVGWVHGLTFGIIGGDMHKVIIYGSFLLAVCILSVIIFIVTKLDYYEDVLDRAESYYEFINNIRSGKVSDTDWLGSKPIKLRKQGINRGKGAATIFFKHLREGARRSRFMFFNINTIVLLSVSAVIGLAMKSFFGEPDKVTVIYIAVTVICSYVQFFFSAAGDWVKELNKPYIFLIPDSPVKKLIMAGATSIIKPFIDGAVSYLCLWLLVGGNLLEVFVCILVYGSFGCIYIASNILAQRIVGISGNRGVFITFYMGIMTAFLIPGVVIGLVLLSSVPGEMLSMSAAILGAPVVLWNFFISFMTFLLCKNLLNNIE